MQPIIISQGTLLHREQSAEQIIKSTFASQSDYLGNMDFKLYELAEDKKLISIDQVRDLIKEINIKPRVNPKKTILIKEAQSLSIEAQNALLKTLEEPPEYSQIILTVDHTDNLIPTVVSRCIVKDLNLSPRVDVDSKEYKEAREDFLEILKMDIGQKIDWVTDNKNKIKDRDQVLGLLNNWEAVLREKMLESLDQDQNQNSTTEWKNKIIFIQKIKKHIQSNANTSLATETLLLNL